MRIGFSLNEVLALLTAATALLAVLWRLRRRARPGGKPGWLAWGADFFGVVALVFGCRVALADWKVVPTGSMEPTVRVGDVILINHLAYGPRLPFTNTALPLGRPQRGDVVVFRDPKDASGYLVKRLVGLPGDQVRFVRDVVSVNGEPLSAAVLGAGERAEDLGHWLVREQSAGRERTIKINPVLQGGMPMAVNAPDCVNEAVGEWHCKVPAGHYLMLGDNRDNSADSRVFGFVPEQELYGRADRVIFNYKELSRFWNAL
ncbi:signal peptidase I [Ideonella sp. BN130291]|uniref:signal peptidase I n=1 Tax=Ideonella sp. BN130291 TaxID=3112940 RepID=UPI002E264C56|nr:signal peptidase I [Ideonella sp. BN130291]